MNRWLLLLILLVAVVFGVGVWQWLSKSLPVQVAEVSRGDIREFVDERGKTRLTETHLITMPFAGRIDAIDFEAGQAVTAGQVLARTSKRDLDEEIAEAKAAVERLQASLAENADTSVEASASEQAELFVESMVSTVAAAEAQKVASKSRLDYSEIFLGRTRNLAETGAETQDDLDRAELNYVESQIGYREDVLNAEAIKSMQAATNLLPRVVREYILRKGLTGDVLAKQKEEAEARLRQALLRQERSEMKSSIDGVILERLVRDEQYLASGTTLLRIGELDRLEVEADILSEDVVRIRDGSEVEIYGPAIGATTGSGVPGVIERIYPTGFTKISSLGVEQQRVRVIIRFADGVLEALREARSLGVDYRVRVRIFTAEQPDATLVPRSALFRGSEGEWQVFVVRNERAALQPVTIGLMNDENAAVTEGLTAGDTVIVAPNIRDNTRVHVAQR
ncbi:MAG: hypothetical protein CMJ64_27990 [Planctomycetaceae bacterium]|nr:hypothetical protein [Planctomycetaceae bacterium]